MDIELVQERSHFQTSIRSLCAYLSAALLSLICAFFVLDLWDPKILYLPFVYDGDEIFYTLSIKSLVTTGWYLTNPMIGSPGVHTLVDFPTPECLNYLIIKFLSLFTSNPILITNLFYLLTFPLITLSSLFVMNRLGLKLPFALCASILFTFLPYHFIRGTNHLFLSAYYTIPLAIWLSVIIYRDQFFSKKLSQQIPCFIACLFIGSTGVYYAYFACFFLCTAGLIASFRIRKWRPLIQSALCILLITSTVILNILPTVIFHHQHGPNPKASHRNIGETEHYGLKIAQLLLPIDGDRIKPLAKIKKKYNHYNAWNENTTATLGLIGSLGFLLLLARLFIQKKEDDTTSALSHFTLSGLLLATIGGVSSLISLLLLKEIRCYNRICVYLAFCAFAGFFLALQRRLNEKKQSLAWITCAILLLFGIYNQTSSLFSLTNNLTAREHAFNKDKLFFGALDQLYPDQRQIFQLPYLSFPEGNHPRIGNYDHFRAPLHSHRLKWSFGAIKGRETDLWQRSVSSAAAGQMIEELTLRGFTGIYLNRKGYKDHGVEIERQLSALLTSPLIETKDASFWDLRNLIKQDQDNIHSLEKTK